ncbi:mobilization relaxase [Salmonella enterica]|nr:mobilization relaxase [Salmonella enterica]
MLVKFMARGKGGGSGPVDYLLGKDRQREGATVLRGDPEQVRELINSAGFSRNYTSAVLSFEESSISPELRQQCMDEFERVLLPGLDADQYSALWVEHTDKGRVELNVVIPNVELQSGKRLQPYYDPADRPRVDAWKTAINAEHGLADPDDPTRQRALSTSPDLPRERKTLSEALTRGLMAQVGEGLIRTRKDVLGAIQSVGLEISRVTRNSISVKAPDGGKNIRLKGTIYERDFEFSQELRGKIEAAGIGYRRENQSRAEAARKRLAGMLENRAEENRKRYPRTQPAIEGQPVKELAWSAYRDAGGPDARRRDSVLDDDRNPQPLCGAGQVAERQSYHLWEAGTVMRGDRSHSTDLWPEWRISGSERGLNEPEPDRATACPSPAGSGNGEGSFAQIIADFEERVRTDTTRQQETSRTSRAIERGISGISASIEHLEAVVMQMRQEYAHRLSRGMSMSR